MNTFLWIISVVGSLISIMGVVFAIRSSNSSKIKCLSVISFLLIIGLSIVSRLYINQIDAENAFERRKERMQNEAAELFKTLPSASYWSPGECEGIIISVGIFLEKYQDIIPDSYSTYRNTFLARINNNKSDYDNYDNRKLMEAAGQQSLVILKGIANK